MKETHGRKRHSPGQSRTMPKKGHPVGELWHTVKQWNSKARSSGGKLVRSKQQQIEPLHTDANCPACPLPHRKNGGKGTDCNTLKARDVETRKG